MESKDVLVLEESFVDKFPGEEHVEIPLPHEHPLHAVPDGGLVDWTQVLAGHLVIFNCWGYITSQVLPRTSSFPQWLTNKPPKIWSLPHILCQAPRQIPS